MTMIKWLYVLCFIAAPVSANTLILGDPSGNDNPGYGGRNSINVNSDGQITQTLQAGENQTLNMQEVSIAGPGSAVSANITQATASNELCDISGGGQAETIGFYVNSTNTGTLRFFDDADGTCSSDAKGAAMTPAVGWHFYPVPFTTAICALTGGTGIDVTVVYRCSE